MLGVSARLGLGVNRGTSIAALGGFSPASLFASSEDGGWYDPSDLTSMYVGRDGSGGNPSAGDVVGRINDKSGNGNHIVAPSDAARPLLQSEGGRYYLDYDGVDDYFAFGSGVGHGPGFDDMTLCLSLNPEDDDHYLMAHGGGAGAWVGVAQDGSTSGVSDGGGAGNPTIRVDGALFSGNRDAFHAAMTGAPRVVTIEGLDYSAGSEFTLLEYNNTIFFGGRVDGMFWIDRALTTTERAALEAYLATKAGATLA